MTEPVKAANDILVRKGYRDASDYQTSLASDALFGQAPIFAFSQENNATGKVSIVVAFNQDKVPHIAFVPTSRQEHGDLKIVDNAISIVPAAIFVGEIGTRKVEEFMATQPTVPAAPAPVVSMYRAGKDRHAVFQVRHVLAS